MAKSTFITITILCVVGALSLFLFSAQSTQAWRFIHFITMPNDLFDPIIMDNFKFHERGYTKEYQLKPKYRGFYEIQISNKNGFNSSDFMSQKNRYDLKGKFKIELFKGEHRIIKKTVSRWTRASFKGNDLKSYLNFSIYEFPIPIEGFGINDIRLKCSVVKPSALLQKYETDIELRVVVSSNK